MQSGWLGCSGRLDEKLLVCIYSSYESKYCNCIVTRGGVYDEILLEPEGNPEGGAQGIS